MVRVAYPQELVKTQEQPYIHTINNPTPIIIESSDIKQLEKFVLGIVIGLILGLLLSYLSKK